MELSKDYPTRRFEAGRAASAADAVVTETRIELDVNDGQARIALLCLPADLEALAVGFLTGEGVLRRPEDLGSVEVEPEAGKILIRGDFDADALENLNVRWTWGSGCGGGGTSRDLDQPAYAALGPGPIVPSGRLVALAAEFGRRAAGDAGDTGPPSQPASGLWRRTGGVHACALADGKELLLLAEDVGRHNAFDKVVGMAVLGGIDPGGKIAITTGRLSAEIVSKAVACRVPILASRSAVTSLAIQLARRFGLTLVGFLRGRRLNVYAGFERIAAEEGEPGG